MSMKMNLVATGICMASSVVIAQDTGTNAPDHSFWKRDTLTGDWGGFRSKLADLGIDFSPVYTGEVMNEAAGGHAGNRTIYDHNLNLPLTVDLEKALGWRGATFHANAFWLAGRSLTDDCIGDLANISNISAYPTWRLNELWLAQTFWDKKASIKIGSLATDSDFFVPAASALFLNSSFGCFSLIAANLPNPPIYPVAAPGVRFWVQPDPRVYFQVGIYDGDSGAQDVNKNGTDFHLAQADGALIFSEIGYNLHPGADDKTLDGALKIGSFIHTKSLQTWSHLIAGSGDPQSLNFGVYGIAEHDLYKRDGQKLTGFIRGGGAPDDRNVIGWYLDAGLNFTGLLPGRANDVAGIAFARSTFSRSYGDYVQATDGFRLSGAEMVIEATYRAQITPWWTVQPDLQIILAPSGDPKCDTALVVGLRTGISF